MPPTLLREKSGSDLSAKKSLPINFFSFQVVGSTVFFFVFIIFTELSTVAVDVDVAAIDAVVVVVDVDLVVSNNGGEGEEDFMDFSDICVLLLSDTLFDFLLLLLLDDFFFDELLLLLLLLLLILLVLLLLFVELFCKLLLFITVGGGGGDADVALGADERTTFSNLLSDELFFIGTFDEELELAFPGNAALEFIVKAAAAVAAAASASAPNILALASAYAFSLSSADCFSFLEFSFLGSLSLFGFLFIIVIFFATGGGASTPLETPPVSARFWDDPNGLCSEG